MDITRINLSEAKQAVDQIKGMGLSIGTSLKDFILYADVLQREAVGVIEALLAQARPFMVESVIGPGKQGPMKRIWVQQIDANMLYSVIYDLTADK